MVLKKLECILDSSESEFFKYEKKKTKNKSKIEADYLAKAIIPKSNVSFVFFLKEKNNDFYIANSTFPMESYDYSHGQVKYTLLFNEKINLKEKTSKILFQHKNIHPKKIHKQSPLRKTQANAQETLKLITKTARTPEYLPGHSGNSLTPRQVSAG